MAHHVDVAACIQGLGAAFGHELCECDHRGRAAERRAVRDAGTAIAKIGILEKSGIGQGDLGRADRHLGDLSHRAGLLARIVVRDGKVGNGRRKPGVDAVIAVPFVHATRRGIPPREARANLRPAAAERRHPAHSGHDYSAHHAIPPLTESTWRVT